MAKFYGKGEELATKSYVDEEIQRQIANALNDVVAWAYDDTLSYDVGDVVIYDNVLYVCNTTISEPEEWTSSHWDRTKVVFLIA